MSRSLLSLALLFLLASCATTPLPVAQGQLSQLTLRQAQASESMGTRVRWGGMIVSVMPLKNETCFEVLSRALDSGGEPKLTDQTEGRFLACGTEFRDPAAFPAGRAISFVGTIQATVTCKIGEFDQRCPRITIESLYLWPQAQPTYYDPFWGPRPFFRYRHWPYF